MNLKEEKCVSADDENMKIGYSANATPIDTIIFDIGNVLVGYDFHKYFMSMVNDCDKTERLKRAFFRSGYWKELDRGIWSEKQLLDAFISADPALKEDIITCYHHVGDALWQFPFAKEWIQDLKGRGYQVLFLSNWSYHLLAQDPSLVDFTPLMDGGIFSCNVKMIKPDHDIYYELIRQYHLNPERSIFLDDNADNIRAAKECGLHGIVVKNHEQAVEELGIQLGTGFCV